MKHELSDLQIEMLKMAKWFHGFCKQNNLTYYMVGGTMLGAARHKGFIPWDDDIDVGIPRKDYDRFLKISEDLRKESNRYIIESYHDGNEDFQYAYAKVYDTNTTLIENKRIRPKRGIFIDVFPLDGIGKNKEDALLNFKPIKKQLNYLTIKTSEVRKGRQWQKNLMVRLFRMLPDNVLSFNTIVTRLDKLCRERSFEDSQYVGNLVGMWREKELMPREAFGKATLYEFEDTMLYGVEKPDMYLTCMYKDWRKLPPIEKQKSDHDFILLDLDHSYIEGVI